jgi:replication factor C subunit 1
MNASDARSQKLLRGAMEGVTDSTVISGLFGEQAGGSRGSSDGKRLIIMDGAAPWASRAHHSAANPDPIPRHPLLPTEVDGMSSGDRGGNAELIKIIEATRTPIIAICNDRDKPSVRSLANHCVDIRFVSQRATALFLAG